MLNLSDFNWWEKEKWNAKDDEESCGLTKKK